jgi:hypothetical protein
MKSYDIFDDNLAQLEHSLQMSLAPVAPNPNFVNNLRQRLYTEPAAILDESPLPTVYLTISFGLFFGVFIFWLIRKITRARIMSLQTAKI